MIWTSNSGILSSFVPAGCRGRKPPKAPVDVDDSDIKGMYYNT